MIKILKSRPISKEEFFSTENQARTHVLPNEPWVAFEVPKGNIQGYEIVTLEVTFGEYSQNVTAMVLVTVEQRLVVAAMGLSYNNLYAAYLQGPKDESLVVPQTVTVGYVDSVYRRKYISTTASPFWNAKMLPVVITK